MACNQANEGEGPLPYHIDWRHDLTNVQLGGFPLFLSNWPERLNRTSLGPGPVWQGVLWHYLSGFHSQPVRIRMFIWHQSVAAAGEVRFQAGETVYVATTLHNPSSVNLTVNNARRQVGTWTSDPLPVGICLAKATLGDTLDSFVVSNVAPQETILIEPAFALQPPPADGQPGGGIGIVYDLTIGPLSPGFTFAFQLRTVASLNQANLAGLTGTPVTVTSNGGGRGYWENNLISADVVLGMAPANPGEHWSITGPGGPDQLFTDMASYDPANAVSNTGNYAVIYDPITIKLTNATQPQFTARARLAARNTGPTIPAPPYAGAVDRGVINGQQIGTRGVPSLQYNSDTDTGDVVLLNDLTVPTGGSSQWSFKLTHAGGATMPVSVLLSTQ